MRPDAAGRCADDGSQGGFELSNAGLETRNGGLI